MSGSVAAMSHGHDGRHFPRDSGRIRRRACGRPEVKAQKLYFFVSYVAFSRVSRRSRVIVLTIQRSPFHPDPVWTQHGAVTGLDPSLCRGTAAAQRLGSVPRIGPRQNHAMAAAIDYI